MDIARFTAEEAGGCDGVATFVFASAVYAALVSMEKEHGTCMTDAALLALRNIRRQVTE